MTYGISLKDIVLLDQNGKPTVNLLEKDSARTNNKLNLQYKGVAS